MRANPLRPELTLGRRAARAGNRRSMAALAEQIVDAETGHTIIYCLTVRDTDWLYAHLRDYLDGRPVLLRKFHGRLPEVDKASVSLEFKEAGHPGDADYARMVVVATSAFGLGVDRDDVRTVFCATPPTDLAALYQQLGRGGRAVAGTDVATLIETTHALAFATDRSLGTAAWLASLDLPAAQLQRFGWEVLAAAARGYLDTARCVERMLAADVQAGLLTPVQAEQPRVRSEWTVGLTRAVAALADLSAVVDSGDVPAVLALGAGIRPPDTPLAVAVAAAVDALPQRGGQLSRSAAPLRRLLPYLHADLGCRTAGLPAAVPGLADLWLLLCDLHDAGMLDVSQRPNDRMLVAVSQPAGAVPAQGGADLPARYAARVQGKLDRAIIESGHLQRFFAATRTCLNERLADYFDVTAPDACCSTDRIRCSVCAGAQDGPGTLPGTPLHALVHGSLQPQGVDAGVRAALLDASVEALLKATFNGLTFRRILLVLTGQDREYVPRFSSYVNLSQRLRDAAQFGDHPGATAKEVGDSLDRLRAARRIVDDGRYVRHAGNAARGPRRTRAQAGPATATGQA